MNSVFDPFYSNAKLNTRNPHEIRQLHSSQQQQNQLKSFNFPFSAEPKKNSVQLYLRLEIQICYKIERQFE